MRHLRSTGSRATVHLVSVPSAITFHTIRPHTHALCGERRTAGVLYRLSVDRRHRLPGRRALDADVTSTVHGPPRELRMVEAVFMCHRRTPQVVALCAVVRVFDSFDAVMDAV